VSAYLLSYATRILCCGCNRVANLGSLKNRIPHSMCPCTGGACPCAWPKWCNEWVREGVVTSCSGGSVRGCHPDQTPKNVEILDANACFLAHFQKIKSHESAKYHTIPFQAVLRAPNMGYTKNGTTGNPARVATVCRHGGQKTGHPGKT